MNLWTWKMHGLTAIIFVGKGGHHDLNVHCLNILRYKFIELPKMMLWFAPHVRHQRVPWPTKRPLRCDIPQARSWVVFQLWRHPQDERCWGDQIVQWLSPARNNIRPNERKIHIMGRTIRLRVFHYEVKHHLRIQSMGVQYVDSYICAWWDGIGSYKSQQCEDDRATNTNGVRVDSWDGISGRSARYTPQPWVCPFALRLPHPCLPSASWQPRTLGYCPDCPLKAWTCPSP